MIEALKSDEIVHKMGGRFKLCALVQHRWVELLQGARPLVERNGRSDLEVIIDEILQGKISIDREKSPSVTEAEKALGTEG
ncbi:MAG TPA: DNA-directed RNA polymerase subunit omega [Phycisphaerae bacterium]|jgi:DNA-directed RNA polymerase subunit omega|nr:DNA-directed RNA polymerase subunit omega [Phycisphaerae bacterium]